MSESLTIDKSLQHQGSLKTPVKIGAVLLLIIFLYLIMHAVLSGMTYLNQYHANATLDVWYKNKQPASLLEWQELESAVLEPIYGDEHNTTMLNVVGRLYDYRSVKMSKNRQDKFLYGDKSIDYYKQVTRQRPAWPYGWMNLAIAKARLGKLDDEFNHALMQLLTIGPWEKTTLLSILQLSLLAWPYLDAHSHQRLLDYFLIAQDKRTGEVRSVVQAFGKTDLYCRLVGEAGVKAVFCP